MNRRIISILLLLALLSTIVVIQTAEAGWIQRLVYCIIAAIWCGTDDSTIVNVSDIYGAIQNKIIADSEDGSLPSACLTALNTWADTTTADTHRRALMEMGEILDTYLTGE